MTNNPWDVDSLAAFLSEVDSSRRLDFGDLAEAIVGSDWLRKRDSAKWAEGAYDFTNGKWGLPEKGENPYGDAE